MSDRRYVIARDVVDANDEIVGREYFSINTGWLSSLKKATRYFFWENPNHIADYAAGEYLVRIVPKGRARRRCSQKELEEQRDIALSLEASSNRYHEEQGRPMCQKDDLDLFMHEFMAIVNEGEEQS